MELNLEERKRVRRALRRYMAAHGIAVLELRQRIADDDPRNREITYSTLYRFLRDAHRTSDFYVAIFQEFVDRLPEEMASDEIAELVDAFEAFLIGPPDGPGRPPKDHVDIAERVAGTYAVYERRSPAKEGSVDRLGVDRGHDVSYARLTLERTKGERVMKATEVVFNPHREKVASAKTRLTFEGAVVPVPRGSALIILRNCLTRQPKCYAVPHGFEIHLEGRALEQDFGMWKAFDFVTEKHMRLSHGRRNRSR